MPHSLNFTAGWWLILAAFASGAVIGLGFHRENFLGGYGSFRRRLLRLGHIAFAALGALNVVYGLSPASAEGSVVARLPGVLLVAGAVAMPLVCFLSAWRMSFRHFFVVPVVALMAAVALILSWRDTMRIGFLPMSGIRAHDKKLLELGLTLPGFVERSRIIASLPSLGLLYLAACTPDGHELRYFEAEADGAEPREIFACDLVAISTFSAQSFEAYAIADRLRAAGVKVALGGLHVSVLPEEALHHADYVVVGEGENVWPAVVEAATGGAPPAIFRARDFAPVDIARLPVPRYDLLGDRPYNRYTAQTTRGCPWRCDFCASTVMLRAPYRRRPVGEVIRDLTEIRRLHPDAFVEFADDNTFVDKQWGRDLCRAMIPLNLRWFTETDLSVADDAELLNLMARAGCRQVLIGLESPSAAPLEGIEQRANRKARWAARYAGAIRTIQAYGITVNACFILGLDGQTTAVFEEIRDFVKSAGLFDVQITVLTPFPGTPLHARLEREGRILHPGAWNLCTLFDINYLPTGMTPQELREGIYWLAGQLYSEEATRRRRKGFFSRLKQERIPA